MKNGSIDFENVAFAYSQKSDKTVLTDINLHIAEGETIGIIGPIIILEPTVKIRILTINRTRVAQGIKTVRMRSALTEYILRQA